MSNPLFWLGLSVLLVAISVMALLTVAIFTLQELARAARSAEKLLDSLNRELPATLQDLRLTGKDLSTLTDEVSGSMQSARSVVQQVDQSLVKAKTQAKQATVTTRSLMAGVNAALRVLTKAPRRRRPPTRRPAPHSEKTYRQSRSHSQTPHPRSSPPTHPSHEADQTLNAAAEAIASHRREVNNPTHDPVIER